MVIVLRFGIDSKRLWFGYDSKFFFGMVMVLRFFGIDSFSGYDQKGYGFGYDSKFFFFGYGFEVFWYRLI